MDIGWQNNHNEYACFSPTMQSTQYFSISNQIKSDLFRHHISQKDESGVFTVQTIVSIKHTLIIEYIILK